MLLDWVRERFSRGQGEPVPGEDMAQQRGFIITLCVLIAVVLWLTLSIGETYTILVEMETQVVNVPPDTALAALPPARVQVQVRGEGTALFGLRFNAPALVIDAAQDNVNFGTLMSLPQGIQIENVNPPSFNLRKEQRIIRKIPIQSRAVIETAESHDFFDNHVLTPDSIVVSGARSIINDLAYWPTEVYQHTGLIDSLSVVIALADTLAGLVEKNHTETTLTAIAYQFTEQTRVLDVEVTGLPTSQRVVEFDPSTVRVTYRIPLSQYDAAMEAPDFFATVSYEAIRADTTGRVRPVIHQPELSLRNVKTSPSTVQYYESLIEQ